MNLNKLDSIIQNENTINKILKVPEKVNHKIHN
jgi:hypothetical protein